MNGFLEVDSRVAEGADDDVDSRTAIQGRVASRVGDLDVARVVARSALDRQPSACRDQGTELRRLHFKGRGGRRIRWCLFPDARGLFFARGLRDRRVGRRLERRGDDRLFVHRRLRPGLALHDVGDRGLFELFGHDRRLRWRLPAS